MIAILCSVCISVGVQTGMSRSHGSELTQAKVILQAIAFQAEIATPALVQSSSIALVFTSQQSGTISMASNDRLSRLSRHEVAAGLAREVAHLKIYNNRGYRAISPVARKADDAKGGSVTMGPWDRETRREAVGYALSYLQQVGEPPAALLTLLECERADLGPLGVDLFDGWVGGSIQELINEAKAVLTKKRVDIRRSEVSLVYRVEEFREAGVVSYRIFDQQLFEISEEAAEAHPHLLGALNAFFDREPLIAEIRSANARLFLGKDAVVAFHGATSGFSARAAVQAMAKALVMYARRVQRSA